LNTDYILSIYNNYLTVKDSIKVTRRSLAKEISMLHNRTRFEDLKSFEANQMMETAGKEFSDLTVLALFASFERQLRDEISTKSSKLQEIIPHVLGDRINELAQKEIERWQIGEIIGLFDFAVDGNVRGKMKQILEYRNWIAHGKNPGKLPSIGNVEPKTTYETIADFIAQIHHYYES
jgi:hypothetical protein